MRASTVFPRIAKESASPSRVRANTSPWAAAKMLRTTRAVARSLKSEAPIIFWFPTSSSSLGVSLLSVTSTCALAEEIPRHPMFHIFLMSSDSAHRAQVFSAGDELQYACRQYHHCEVLH